MVKKEFPYNIPEKYRPYPSSIKNMEALGQDPRDAVIQRLLMEIGMLTSDIDELQSEKGFREVGYLWMNNGQPVRAFKHRETAEKPCNTPKGEVTLHKIYIEQEDLHNEEVRELQGSQS